MEYDIFKIGSFILIGNLSSILAVFERFNVPLQLSGFHKDKGYVFMTRAGSENEKELMDALNVCPDVTAVSCMCGQGMKEYISFCKNSIVPVEIEGD